MEEKEHSSKDEVDLTGARAIEIGNQVLFVKEEEDQEAGGSSGSGGARNSVGGTAGSVRTADSSRVRSKQTVRGVPVGFGSELVEVVPFGAGLPASVSPSGQVLPEAYLRGEVSGRANYTLIPRPLYAPWLDIAVNPLASNASSETGVVMDSSARPHLYQAGGGGGGGRVWAGRAGAYDALWELKGRGLYTDHLKAEARKPPEDASERLEQGSQVYPPGKKWMYNGAPLRKHRFNETSNEWVELDEEEDSIEYSKTLPTGETYVYPTGYEYGYQWFPDGFDERPEANYSIWDMPGRRIRQQDIQHLPPRRQKTIMDLSLGVDPDSGLSNVDLAFQDELLEAVQNSFGTPREHEALSNYYYYMFGIEEGEMAVPLSELHELPEKIYDGAIRDPVFAERMCGGRHMKTLLLAEPALRETWLAMGIPTLDANTTRSRPPTTCDSCASGSVGCSFLRLRDGINNATIFPLTRSLPDEEGRAEEGVWVQGRYVVGVESEELTDWQQQQARKEAQDEAEGLFEEGEEEGARGFASDTLAFGSNDTLWYLRRLHYSMYLANLTAAPGSPRWCGGRQEIQELVAEVYGVDVHLHSFLPSPAREAGEVEWQSNILSFYPRSTLPSGSWMLPPERPLAALHLCLCGNHFWAAPYDSDIWERNNFDLREANYDPLTDAEYDALSPAEKENVVLYDRFNDPVVKMYFEDELAENATMAMSDEYLSFDIQDSDKKLEMLLDELLKDEDPYWLYMWNETFKAGLRWSPLEGCDGDAIEWSNITGLPLLWEDPALFDWGAYAEFRKKEDQRTNLVFADGSSPPRSREDLELSILKLQALYTKKASDLTLAEAEEAIIAVSDAAVAAPPLVAQQVGDPALPKQPLQSRRDSLAALKEVIDQSKAKLDLFYPQRYTPSSSSTSPGAARAAAASRGTGRGGFQGDVDEAGGNTQAQELLSDDELLRQIARDIGGTYLNVDDLPDS